MKILTIEQGKKHRWTEHDKWLVGVEASKILRAEGEPKEKTPFLARAQRMLPEDYQARPQNWAMVCLALKLGHEYLKKGIPPEPPIKARKPIVVARPEVKAPEVKAPEVKAPAPEPVPVTPAPAEAKQWSAPAQVIAEAVEFLIQEVVQGFATTLGRTIGDEMAKSIDGIGVTIANAMRDHLSDVRLGISSRSGYQPLKALSIAEPPKNAHERFGNLPEKFHQPKVLIVGLLPAQQQEIKNQFKKMEFRFLNGDTSSKVVADLMQRCDGTFVTKWVSHKAITGISGKYHMVNGGMTDLVRLISHHFPGEILPPAPVAPREYAAAQH